MGKKYYCFWTGGWDSTFMILEQLRNGKTIQPIYVIDDKRVGNTYEKKAMKTIIEKIESMKLKGKLLPIEYVDISTIEKNERITESYKKIKEKTNLGTQHDWLSRFAKQRNIEIMLGTENGSPESSHIIDALSTFCTLYEDEDGVKRIDKEKTTEEGLDVFENMLFPIVKYYETDMLKLVKEWNMEDVMKNIWFCHNPIKGKPCGLCHPCEVKMESQMEFLLPEKSQKRYKNLKKIKKTFGSKMASYYSKIIRKLNK